MRWWKKSANHRSAWGWSSSPDWHNSGLLSRSDCQPPSKRTHEKSCESRPFFQGRKSSKIRYQIRWKRMKKNVHQPKQKVLVLSWRISVLVLKFDRHTTHYIAWSLDWLQKILEVLEVVASLDGAQLRSLNGEAGHMRLWYHLDPLGRDDQIHYYPLVNLQKTMEIHHL